METDKATVEALAQVRDMLTRLEQIPDVIQELKLNTGRRTGDWDEGVVHGKWLALMWILGERETIS